jgi:hypothetical protein
MQEPQQCEFLGRRLQAVHGDDDRRGAVNAPPVETLPDDPQRGQGRSGLERLGASPVPLGEDPLELADARALEERGREVRRGGRGPIGQQADRQSQPEHP